MENKNEQQVSEIMPEPIEEPKKSKKGQMAKGVACGIAGTILVGFVALNVVTKITGTKIYITNATAKTDSILDTKTVQKINELKAYTDMYYYDNVDDTELKDGLYEGMISGLGIIWDSVHRRSQLHHFRLQIALLLSLGRQVITITTNTYSL